MTPILPSLISYPRGRFPPTHSPLRLEAAILSRIRSEVTSRSNWAKDSSTLRVSRPMAVVVLNCWVTETKETPWASNSWRDEIIDHVALAAKSAGKAFLKGSQELAL